jgi:hypothetical protein
MKRFLASIALTCLLSVCVLAGDMPISGLQAPVDPTSATSTEEPGEIPTSGAPEQVSSDARSVVLSMLSFLVR